ncbi:MAG: HEPN domain-containing protein [Elusimicrobia bacterium]|nr:HEPN domain-containing protein [Elusimicrobiota bacterium]
MKQGEILKDRADRFFKNALELFKRREYDLSAFNLEQSSQLFLKYGLWKKLGDFEKTHKISRLLADLQKVSSQKKIIGKLIKNYQEVIADLEIAYIESRYLPVEFFPTQLQKMIKFVEKLKKIIETEK